MTSLALISLMCNMNEVLMSGNFIKQPQNECEIIPARELTSGGRARKPRLTLFVHNTTQSASLPKSDATLGGLFVPEDFCPYP